MMADRGNGSTPSKTNGLEKQTYTIDYFLDFIQKLNSNDQPGKNINWIVRNNIAKSLVNNPNLTVLHLKRLLALLPPQWHRDILKDVLARDDRRHFIDIVFDYIDNSKESLAVYLLCKSILFDKELSDYHRRALDMLLTLKSWRTYNVKIQEFLPGPCISYRFFIRDMLSNAGSVEEANRWLDEYSQVEELFVQGNTKASGGKPDPQGEDRYRKRERITNYLNLAGNKSLPYDYLKGFQAYVDETGEEYQKVAYLGALASHPGITAEEYKNIFEKRKLIKEKNLVNSLLALIASNPKHYNVYYNHLLKYIDLKPTSGRHSVLSALARNPGVGDKELNQLLDILLSVEYDLSTKSLNYLLRQIHLILFAFMDRKDLTGEHHEKIRQVVIRYLDTIDGDAKMGYGYMARIEDFSLPEILSRIRLNGEFVDYLFSFASRKPNGGVFLSGLLPNPGLTPEHYSRIVDAIEKQYVGKEAELLVSQRGPFWIEKVYGLWPASRYVS